MINRIKYNYRVLRIITVLINKFPDWRFTQLLSNVGLDKDKFYEEPDKTYSDLVEWCNKHNIVI